MVTLLTTPPASVAHAPLGDDHRSIRPVLAHGHRAAGRAPIHPVLDVPTTIVVMITIPEPHGRSRRVDAHRLRKRGRCDCKRRCGCSHRQKNTHVVVPPKRRRHAAVRCISAAGGIGSNAPQFLANGPLKLERKKPRTCGASCSPVLRGAGGVRPASTRQSFARIMVPRRSSAARFFLDARDRLSRSGSQSLSNSVPSRAHSCRKLDVSRRNRAPV